MLSTNSPLESLAAFSIVFLSGILLAVGFSHYVNQLKQQAQTAQQAKHACGCRPA